MKTPILTIFFVAAIHSALANKVDNLKTNKDVEKFIVSLDTEFRQKGKYALTVKTTKQLWADKECGSLAKKAGIKSWTKSDFNNDGRTDLLANAYWDDGYLTFVAIDRGNDEFELTILHYGPFDKCQLSKTVHTIDGQLLMFYSDEFPEINFIRGGKKIRPSTLIYKYGHFVELTKLHRTYKIDSIIFHSGICYGMCPDFSIKLDKNGSAIYEAGAYSPKKGTFKSSIEPARMEEIKSLMEYIQIKKLKKNYRVPWTDDATATITVKFSDGTVKNISDYGELGTFGLRALYSIFFNLAEKQKWQ